MAHSSRSSSFVSQIDRFRRSIIANVFDIPPVQNGVITNRNIRVPMSDGIMLATDHYQPDCEMPRPTVLIRTPYSKGQFLGVTLQLVAQRFAERGYNVIIQDVRGKFESEGEFEPWVHEAQDGLDTVNWLVEQPWSDGQVVAWGVSYLGSTSWALAATHTPHLKAMMPVITQSFMGFDNNPNEGLIFDTFLRWIFYLDTIDSTTLPFFEKMPRLLSTWYQDRFLRDGFTHLPLGTVDEKVMGYPISFYKRWTENSDPESHYWRSIDLRQEVSEIDIPIYFVSGWYDIFLGGLLKDYQSRVQAGHTPYLTIGPWIHSQTGSIVESVKQAITWFDAHLNDNPQLLPEKPVRLFVMGANEWHEFDAFPPEADETQYYLQANSGLHTSKPLPDTQPDHYVYDPSDPTPNLGGALLSNSAGSQDQRPLEERDDVLIYTSPPLKNDTTVIGEVICDLYVSTNLQYTDFFARLCDVHPNGKSMNICEGLYRIHPDFVQMPESGILQIQIKLNATAHMFKQGHAVRLHVCSGAHPRIARNLGTGEDYMTATDMCLAYQSVFHDASHPSVMKLPIVR